LICPCADDQERIEEIGDAVEDAYEKHLNMAMMKDGDGGDSDSDSGGGGGGGGA
jgi:hypothetical protein